MEALRKACATVAERARFVRIVPDAIAAYAAALPLDSPPDASAGGSAAFWLTLDAINFGSGWFPTLRKPPGRSGYRTIEAGIRRRFDHRGPWSADELARIDPAEIAATLGQDPVHELMELFARSLRDLGRHVRDEHSGRFEALAAGDSAVALARRLGRWECFADVSSYDGLAVPFLKRAQIAAADLARAGAARFDDLDRLTMFADNLVPHVLRLDGVLRFDPGLVARIDREEPIEHGSPEEVEIRACALHAVELIVAAAPQTCAAQVDQVLWLRGQEARYKAVPRHRSRCTAY
jgi:Queuosine salvage protein